MYSHRKDNLGNKSLGHYITVKHKRNCSMCIQSLESEQQSQALWVGSRQLLYRCLIKTSHIVTDACISINAVFYRYLHTTCTFQWHNSAPFTWKHRNVTCVIYKVSITALCDVKQWTPTNCNGRGNIVWSPFRLWEWESACKWWH